MKRKILVVDDIPAVKEFILDALEHDYDVTGVGNGKDALAALSKESYEMVVTDIAMPDMNGEELTTTIKQKNPRMPVVAITNGSSRPPRSLRMSFMKLAMFVS